MFGDETGSRPVSLYGNVACGDSLCLLTLVVVVNSITMHAILGFRFPFWLKSMTKTSMRQNCYGFFDWIESNKTTSRHCFETFATYNLTVATRMTTARSAPETDQSTDGVLQLDTHVSLRRVQNDRIHFLNLDRCLRQPCTISAVSTPETITSLSLAKNYLLRMPMFVSDYTNLIELNVSHNEFNNAEFVLHRALNEDELSESYRTERLSGITKESPSTLIDRRLNRESTVRRSVKVRWNAS